MSIVDGPITFSSGAVAAACVLWLPSGILTINDWGGGPVFTHDFGSAGECALCVIVTGRDEANAHKYDETPDRGNDTISSSAERHCPFRAGGAAFSTTLVIVWRQRPDTWKFPETNHLA